MGRCTLGFAFARGSVKPGLHQPPVNPPHGHARWTRPVLQWHDCVAALFAPSVETTDIMVKVEALTNFTKQALTNFTKQPLLDSTKAIQALNKKQIQMEKTVIQNKMTLNIQQPKEGLAP